MNMHKVAVIGATGNVGRKVVQMLLEKQCVSPKNLHLFASARSAGQILTLAGHSFSVQSAEDKGFLESALCLFNTESDISEKFVPIALASGAYIVDSSAHYRLAAQVPLIIPPVNKHQITRDQKLYAHANCLVSPIATVVAPLHHFNTIKRLQAVTYQSTSGAGKAAVDDCWNETRALVNGSTYERQHFKQQIAFNVIPQVGTILSDGMTSEEYKITHELKKVIDPNIAITATAVRVPVMIGHSIALTLEFDHAFELSDMIEILRQASSIKVDEQGYTTPAMLSETDDVYVGRIRRDPSLKNGLHLWLCSNNLRRGAATDSVEIATSIIQQFFVR